MKVLYFLTGVGFGGIGKFVSDIVSNTDEKIQYTFFVLSDRDNPFLTELEQYGNIVIASKWNVGMLEAFYQVVKNGNYDIVHAHAGFWSWIILTLSRICGVKIRIAHSHSADSFSNISGLPKFIYLLSRIMNSSSATTYFACSNHACKQTFGKKVLLSSKYFKILNSVDDRFFSSKQGKKIRNEFDIKSDEILVCHVGYFGTHKNQQFIIDLAKEMKNKNVKWILVGNGYKLEEMKNKADKMGLQNVIFTGNRTDIQDILDASDYFILPSVLEGFGTVVIEAQACGVPVIISENVTMETDMGLGLVRQINLSNVDEWNKEILSKKKKVKDIEFIKKVFESKAATACTAANNIEEIYFELMKR